MRQSFCRVFQVSVLCLFVSSANGHPGHGDGDEAAPAELPNFQYDAADETVAADHADAEKNPLLYDGDVLSHRGRLYFAWLRFTPGKGDSIVLEGPGTFASPAAALPQEQELAAPSLTLDGEGEIWLTFEQRVGDQWDVFALPLREGREPVRVSDGTGSDIHHRAAGDPGGGIWIAWQSDRDGQFGVLARHVTARSPGDVQVVEKHGAGQWRPDVAVNSKGDAHFVWDVYDGESFNVHCRTRTAEGWGEIKTVAGSDAFEGRAAIAVDKRDRVWIAWEEGAENWGKPYRGIDTLAITDQHGPLHRFRRLHVALEDERGRFSPLADALPLPSHEAAADRTSAREGVQRSGAFYERARLSVDEAGRLWIAYRHCYTPWLGVEHRSHVEQGWGVYARYLGEDGWSPLYQMSVGQGDGMQRLEFTPHDGGVALAWTTGRTHREKNDRPRGVFSAAIAGRGEAAARPELAYARPREAKQDVVAGRERPQVEVAGKRYRLFYGDLHRHTDFSLCRVPNDGTIDDAYRYASEVARLDFLGITDHSRDLAMGDHLSQLWWRSRKEVYRYELSEMFLPFYAYERSHSNTADHNVISLKGDMLRPHTYPVPEFWKELDESTITIPHQPIRRDTWNYQNDALRPLLEIFQGCRDISIEEDAHRGLALGYKLGFIASSDHLSTSASYACVWAEEPTRESIFAALKARRTFGATANIELAVMAGERWMGDIVRAAEMPEVVLTARGTAPIRSIQIIVDGEQREAVSPNERQVELKRAFDLKGSHYIYFHLVQADGNQAWSSPLWFEIGD